MEKGSYVIRGGIVGRERLRLLSRVLRKTTMGLLERAGLRRGMSCLDVGCGGGDVTFEIARIAGPEGHVVGLDIDAVKIDIAAREARELGLTNIEFKFADITELDVANECDFVYSRFLLTHLTSPELALGSMFKALRPGGVIVLEDIDFTGHFCKPENEAFSRYVALYTEVVRRNGGDANIGPRLPRLLLDAGCLEMNVGVTQLAGSEGELKLIAPITMENIADAVVRHELASATEVSEIVEGLYDIGNDDTTLVSLPRLVQVIGKRPDRCP